MNNKVILVAVVVLILGGGALLLLSNKAQLQPANQTTNESQNTPTKAVQQPTEETLVKVTSAGYEPKTITVKPGAKVVWKNETGGPVTVSSDNHPTHLLWPFLNLGKFEDGSSVSVVFDKAGTYTYHNHLDASMTGTVVVK
jgi:plastocyanin